MQQPVGSGKEILLAVGAPNFPCTLLAPELLVAVRCGTQPRPLVTVSLP